MAQPVIQHAFHSGEWAPSLYARVDLAKYHAAASLMRNFFVDYRGGASTRYGTKYILQGYKSATPIRVIPFQASFTVSYTLEFGQNYIRFYNNGSAVLENAKTITAISQANPASITSAGHGYNAGDWVFLSSIGGMTELNGLFFEVLTATTNTFTIGNILDGSNVNSTGYPAYTTGGTAQRVYTLNSPYAASDLALLKFAQNINTLTLTHPSYPPYVLTLVSATNWTLNAIVFGTTIGTPTSPSCSTSSGGVYNFSYDVTAVDVNGQESIPSAVASSTVTTGTQTITFSWTAVSGAVSYNVYRAGPSISTTMPSGAAFGFLTNQTGVSLVDSFNGGVPIGFPANYDETFPIAQNPFQGAGVQSVTVTNGGSYTTTPTVTFSAAPSGGVTATGLPVLDALTAVVPGGGGGNNYVNGDLIYLPDSVILKVASTGGIGVIASVTIVSPGSTTSIPANPVTQLSTSGSGSGAEFNLTWQVINIGLINSGSGYTSAPTITFSAGTAAVTANLATASAGNPSTCTYFDQRLYLMGPPGSPQQGNASQPLSFFNFNTTDPAQADNAISFTLDSTILNSIKWGIPMSQGLIILSDRQAWLLTGGSGAGTPPSAINAAANSQAYNGAADVPPIVATQDIIYVQAKGSIVRDLTFNYYTQIYTGTDISVLSSHLFFSYTVKEWAWAEEPWKVVWAVRNDGELLSLTFLKEQEIIGWAHHDTQGTFESVCTVVEAISQGNVDAIYVVVQRTINGNTVQYIERMADRYPVNYNDTSIWCVDAGLQYNSTPATTFTGLNHLIGATVVGLADGVPFTTTVSAAGSITLGTAASVVTVGLSFTPQLGTLPLDTGEPTIQSKQKKPVNLDVRCKDALGLWCGRSLTTTVQMKDLVLGNVGSMSNQQVTNLVTSDARTIMDPQIDPFGIYYIVQPNPYPATVLGVIPTIVVGDTP